MHTGYGCKPHKRWVCTHINCTWHITSGSLVSTTVPFLFFSYTFSILCKSVVHQISLTVIIVLAVYQLLVIIFIINFILSFNWQSSAASSLMLRFSKEYSNRLPIQRYNLSWLYQLYIVSQVNVKLTLFMLIYTYSDENSWSKATYCIRIYSLLWTVAQIHWNGTILVWKSMNITLKSLQFKLLKLLLSVCISQW